VSNKRDDLFKALSIAGVATLALFILLLFKIKGGLLGLILGVAAIATLIYWLSEMRSLLRDEAYPKNEEEFFYDLLDEGEELLFVAKVPGPAEEVQARLKQGFLEVKGGGKFLRSVKVSDAAELEAKSYINGVLQVRLRKSRKVSKGNQEVS
jgi:HSP20 family molecular chaperone IbpA